MFKKTTSNILDVTIGKFTYFTNMKSIKYHLSFVTFFLYILIKNCEILSHYARHLISNILLLL